MPDLTMDFTIREDGLRALLGRDAPDGTEDFYRQLREGLPSTPGRLNYLLGLRVTLPLKAWHELAKAPHPRVGVDRATSTQMALVTQICDQLP